LGAKYKQVADSLIKRIRAGEIAQGDRLPGEFDLAQAYEVSRGTIRQALASLQQAGVIETWTGAGSFVRYDGAFLDDRVGWSKALARQGIETTSRVLRFEQASDDHLAGELGLNNPTFLVLDRVRSLASGEAISLERSRLPWREEFRQVLQVGLTEGSLQRTLEDLKIRSVWGSEEVSLVHLNADEAELLGRPSGDAFLATRRTVRDHKGAIVERVDSLLHPVHFKLQFNFVERPT